MQRHSYTNIGTKNTAAVFVDTNVAVDLITRREPFYKESEFVRYLAERHSIDLLISAGTVTTMIYLATHKYKLHNANSY